MATTRQLRGGDYVLRVEEEDLDIMLQGITKLEESSPDFSKVPAEFRQAMERTYAQWEHRVENLKELITNVVSEEEAAGAEQPEGAKV